MSYYEENNNAKTRANNSCIIFSHLKFFKSACTFSLWCLTVFRLWLIVLGGSPLLAPDHTLTYFQVFIFASWSSPPVRVGWAPHEADTSLQGFPSAWFMIARFLGEETETERHSRLLLASVPRSVCVRCQSSAGTSRGMLTITACWGIMNQECQFWSTTRNYFAVLRGPLNGSLSEQEREREQRPLLKPLAFTAEWFLLAKL